MPACASLTTGSGACSPRQRLIRPALASPRVPTPVPRTLPSTRLVTIEAPIGINKSIPNRHPAMPEVFQVKEHPLVDKTFTGDIYILYGDFTKEGNDKLLKKVGTLNPYDGKGFLRLDTRHRTPVVFARNMYGIQGEPDKLKTWARSRKDCTAEELAARTKLREEIIGNVDEVSADAPTGPAGSRKGGTAFERSPRASPVHDGGRAYTISLNLQHPRQLAQPSKGLKRDHSAVSGADDYLNTCRDYVEIIGKASVATLKAAVPREDLRVMEAQVDSINMPRIGVSENIGSPAFQLNIVGAVGPSGEAVWKHVDPITSNETDVVIDEETGVVTGVAVDPESGAIKQLGTFGVIHIDAHDLAAFFTVMHVLSEDDDRIEEQRFFLLELGIYWVLREHDSIGFSGLHFHGGTPPVFKEPQPKASKTFIRMTAVAYCPTHFFDGQSSWAFGVMPQKESNKDTDLFRIPREMQVWEPKNFFDSRPRTNNPNMISDSASIMDPQSYLNFLARGLNQIGNYFILQAPPEYLARIKRSQFLGSISLVTENRRLVADPWPYGPRWSDDDCKEGPLDPEFIRDLHQAVTALEYRHLQASNDPARRNFPFGNPLLDGSIAKDFEALGRRNGDGIPICTLAEQVEGPVGGNAAQRRSTFQKARNGVAEDESLIIDTSQEDDSRPKRKSSKRKLAQVDDVEALDSKRKRHATRKVMPTYLETESSEALLLQALDFTELELLHSKLGHYTMVVVGEDRDAWNAFLDAAEMGTSSAPERIGAAISHARYLSVRRDASDMLLRLENQDLILHRMVLWKWLEHEVAGAWDSVNEGSSGHWLKSLCSDVCDAFTTLRSSPLKKTWNASRYIPLAVEESHETITMTFGRKVMYELDSRQVQDRLLEIVSFWLNFPTSYERGRPEAEVASRLVSSYGPGVLLHKPVIDACQNPRRMLFGGVGSHAPSFAAVKAWCDDNLEVADNETRSLVDEVSSLCDVWRTPEQRFLPSKLDAIIADGISQFYLNAPNASPSSSTSSNSALSLLKSLLEPLFPLVRSRTFDATSVNAPSSSRILQYVKHYKAYIAHVISRGDKKNPWRDLADSRSIVLQDDGPFDEHNLHTIHGLFSALIYRGVTHNSQFLLEEKRILFNNLEDWNNGYASLTASLRYDGWNNEEIATFFCNPCAYGSWTGRNVESVPKYWSSVQIPALTAWLLQQKRPSFTWLYHHFCHEHTPSSKQSAFPQYGPLQAFLLASDYAIAGAAQLPTRREWGELLTGPLKAKGAMRGLMFLGFKVDTAEETADAFYKVHDILQRVIPEPLRRRMNFNVFTTEHILCKVKRLNVLVFRKLMKSRAALNEDELRTIQAELRVWWEEGI